jgi:glutathione S-transferase
MLTLFSDQRSGNCYKVRLGLAQLRRRHTLVEVDILKGETRTPDFLARNPAGRVPLLEVAPGRYLSESGAILWHLAEGSRLIPQDAYERADMLRWMFFEQYSHEPYIGTARFWLTLVKGGRDLQAHLIEDWMERGYQALSVMERHLKTNDWFASRRYTIADIALYAYTHVAHEADFDLTGFPAIRGWLRRVASEPGHITMDWRPSTAPIAG